VGLAGKRPLRRRASVILFLALWGSALGAANGEEGRRHEVFFPHTPYELHCYRIQGREPGPTLLIIGGIQGNEPGGYLAADRFVDLTLKRGNLIVVPRANFYAILKNQRGPHGDMNRRFRDVPPKDYVDRIVDVLKELMSEADCLLNLHDGSGFYSPKWEGPRRNPLRYGQSIIADADVYRPPGGGPAIRLREMALRVIRRVNPQIRDERHHFLFNNHRTLEKDTLHPEQRTSATFYALTRYGIPAFGVETSKDIPDFRVRVEYQTMVINAFLDELGIVPDHPPRTYDPPQLQYVLLSVNGGIPLAVAEGETLDLHKGDVVQVRGVVANYQRGISVDVLGLGSENDMERPLVLRRDTALIVRKDSKAFGRIRLRVVQGKGGGGGSPAHVKRPPRLRYFFVEVNGQKRLIENYGRLHVVRGDLLRLLDVLVEGSRPERLRVNFVGFVGDWKENTGEDRGFLIRTAKDLWARYSLDKKGRRYRVVALEGKSLLGEMEVVLHEPRFRYLVVQKGGGSPVCVFPEKAITVRPGEELRILALETNVAENLGVEIVPPSKGTVLEQEAEGWVLRLDGRPAGKRPLQVTRYGIPMGRIWIHSP